MPDPLIHGFECFCMAALLQQNKKNQTLKSKKMKTLISNYTIAVAIFIGIFSASCHKDINPVTDASDSSTQYNRLTGNQMLDSFAYNLTAAVDSLNAIGLSYVIVQNGEVVKSYSYGVERNNAAGANPFTPGSILALDSISGTFTHLALLSTLQRNNVSLDSFIFKYCPRSWNIPAVNKTITFRHLVEHKAGLDSFGLSITDFKRSMETPSASVGVYNLKFMDYGIVRMLLPAVQKIRAAYSGSTRVLDSLIATDFRTLVRQNAFKQGGMRYWNLANFSNWYPNSTGNALDSLYPFVQYHNADNPSIPGANGRNFFYSTARTGMYLSATDAGTMYYNLVHGNNQVTAALDSAGNRLLGKVAVGSLSSYSYCSGTYKAGARGQAATNILMDFPEDNMVVVITSNSSSTEYKITLSEILVSSFEAAKN